jgi:thymidylate kinase
VSDLLFGGVVLEGVACAGKSSLLRALLAHPTYITRQGSSSVVLTEHHTQRVLEGRGPRAGLTAADNVGLLRTHVEYLRALSGNLARVRAWRENRRPNPRLSAILERFHLSHVLGYHHLAWDDVQDVDRDLAALGFHLCLVVASPDELRRRLAGRGEQWGTFLGEPGVLGRLDDPENTAARADHFIDQQDQLRALAVRSRLPVTEIDASVLTPVAAAEIVLERL